MRLCVVIPTYNHGAPLRNTLEKVSVHGWPVFVVDDGSDEKEQSLIASAANEFGASVLRLEQNSGKGGAVMAGLAAASEAGFTHALQVDADGQHNFADIGSLVAASQADPGAMIAGEPQFDDSVPSSRLYGRRLTNFWVAVEGLTTSLPDAMCGFRVYPLDACMRLMRSVRLTRRMDFDIEILVRLSWMGVPIVPVPTTVRYFEGAVSNFHLWRDNWLITKIHIRLVFGMLIRVPKLLSRRLRRRNLHWSRIGERGGVLGMRLIFAIYRTFGRKVFAIVLLPVMGWFYLTAGPARRCSKEYLGKVRARRRALGLPDTEKLSSFRHFMAFGNAVLDKGAMWAGAFDESTIQFDNIELYKSVRARPEGLFFIGSHLGNLEALRAYGETAQGLTVNALVYTRHSQGFLRVLSEVNPSVTAHMIEVDSMGPESIIRLRQKIEAREHVAMVGDRTSVSTDERSVQVEFLGEKACFPEGPFVIAHLLACPVYLIFCLQRDGIYTIHLEKFTERLELPRESRQQALEEYAAQYAQRLESYCLRAPLQWFNFYDFWADPSASQDNYASNTSVANQDRS